MTKSTRGWSIYLPRSGLEVKLFPFENICNTQIFEKREKEGEKIYFLRNSPPPHVKPDLASFHTTQLSPHISPWLSLTLIFTSTHIHSPSLSFGHSLPLPHWPSISTTINFSSRNHWRAHRRLPRPHCLQYFKVKL